MSGKKQKIIILVGGFVVMVVLLIMVLWQLSLDKTKIKPNVYVPDYDSELGSGNIEADTPDWEETEFRQTVPSGVQVPEAGEIVPEELKDIIAVPHDVLPPRGSSDSEGSVRRFEIKAEGNKFSPSQVVVNYNDIVDISISALDKDYDFILPSNYMQQNIAQGESKKINFQATQEGRLKFYCESCGGVDSSATGEIVVVR